MNKLSFMFISILLLPACGPKHGNGTAESMRIDSLVQVRKLNDRALIVSFGYDALTAIKTTKGIVLIDAGISTSLTARYKKLIENEFGEKNFIYVINTHGHHDHIRGNSVFPEAKVIGHQNLSEDAEPRYGRDSMLVRLGKISREYESNLQHSIPGTPEWKDLFTQEIRYEGAYRDLKDNLPFRLPDLTFADSLELDCGDLIFEMTWFGKFHSASDILIHIPELKLLFSGDLFSQYGRPGYVSLPGTVNSRWICSISWIKKRMDNIETIIDGHGDILNPDDLKSFLDKVTL